VRCTSPNCAQAFSPYQDDDLTTPTSAIDGSPPPDTSDTPVASPENMSAPSLAPFIQKRPWLLKWMKPLSSWYCNAAGYRQLGLR
jgi:hypothetical protein